jgi:hypothetical protein
MPRRCQPTTQHDIASRHLGLWEAWVFVSDANETERQAVAYAARDALGRENVIEEHRWRGSLF